MLGIGAFFLACTTVVSANNDAVLVYFSMAGCAACKTAEPSLRQLEQNGVVVRRVDADREPELAQRYRVEAFPTFVVVRGGREVSRFVGAQSLNEVYAAIVKEVPNRLTNTASESPSPFSPPTDQPATRLAPLSTSLASAPDRAVSRPAASTDMASAVLRAERATVRIRVYDGQGFGVGTGTIIDVHGEEALVLTCGHIFRDTQGKGRIEIDLFVGGRTQTLPGTVIDYDATTRDIGLISFRPGMPVVPTPVVGTDDMPVTGQSAFSYGCDHGADPTRRDTRVSAINKFKGPQNIEISGAPVEGRSGGGLFDQQGRLIGVCNAADHQDNEGLYAGPQVIHWQLDRVELTHLYKNSGGAMQLASNTPSPSNARDELAVRTASATHGVRSSEPAMESLGAPSSNAKPFASSMTGDEEVICIVRSRSNPSETPRVLTIAKPSPELLDLINASAPR